MLGLLEESFMGDVKRDMSGRRWPKRLAIVLAVLAALCAGGFAWYVSDYYHADSLEVAASVAAGASVEETDSYIAVGEADAACGLVLYPGAKVEALAYVPLAEELAERGVYCVIAKMPFNLAFFGIDAAAGAMAAAPEVGSWWIGGHSLGGVAAAEYAAGHADDLGGIVLLASYATADLSGTGLAALSVYGDADGVLNFDALSENAGNLPAGAETVVIEGGNHAGFGTYGAQDGDGLATISGEQQREQTAEAIVAGMRAASAASA